jgi:hypothetical protein
MIVLLAAPFFRRDRRRRWDDMYTAVLFFGFTVIGTFLSVHLMQWFPRTIDPLLLRADHAIGFDTLRIAHWLITRHYLAPLLADSYNVLSIMMALAWVVEQNPATRWSCLFAGLLCFAFYAAFPAVGPLHYDFVAQVPARTLRNCVPSMHLSWALLIAWNARAPRFRVPLMIYAGLMAVATIAVGEHYLVDLLLAIPFTIAVQWLTVWMLKNVPALNPAWLARPQTPAPGPAQPAVENAVPGPVNR